MNILRPYKSDIRQIDSLVKLGCNYFDIAGILGITESELKKWESKNTKVSELLKPKALPEYTLNHPDYAPMVEEAFACAGKRYYRFKEEYRMSTGRYKYYYAALREVEMKASLETLNKYVSAFESILNGGSKGKKIEIGTLWELVINLKSRIKLAFDPQTVRDLAAIAYFDETEDLTTYDKKYGDGKIKIWNDHQVYAFFLTRPISELFNVNGISITSLAGHLREMDGVIADLNSNLQTVSEDNS